MMQMLLRKFLSIWQDFSPLLACAGAAIALHSVRENIRIHKRNKRADAMFHCNHREEELSRSKVSLRELSPHLQDNAIEAWYSRYWELRSDEFDYLLADLVDADTFSNRSFHVLRGFQDNHNLVKENDTCSFHDGWLLMGKLANNVTNPWFTEFVEILVKLALIKDLDQETKHGVLVDVLCDIESKSAKFRRNLRHGLSFKDYKKTRHGRPTLCLEPVLEQSIARHRSSRAGKIESQSVMETS